MPPECPLKYKTRKSYNDPGHAHELTFTTYHRVPLFASEALCSLFLECLSEARKKHEFEIWAFVLMSDHVHLLVWPINERYSMPTILKAIKQPFARRLTNLWRETAPEKLTPHLITWPSGRTEVRIWQQGGGYDRNMTSKKAIHASIDYIHNNPVVAGLAQTPCEYRWSSASWFEGSTDVPFVPDMMR